jgi:hypothetical protein
MLFVFNKNADEDDFQSNESNMIMFVLSIQVFVNLQTCLAVFINSMLHLYNALVK